MFPGLKNPNLRRVKNRRRPALLIYIYDLNNTLKGRVVNGVTQNFVYDKKGQLTGVTDSNGAVLESYKYDAAGNILEKLINGAAVNYTYDKANQLLTATMPDGIRKSYKYDAAGRLVEEIAGNASKSYSYGWSDKVTKVTDGKVDTNFSYYPNGQLARRSTDKTSENFYWDGLALLKRDNTNYLNEPYVTGGNPVLAADKLVLNDMLGTSIGSIEDGNFKYIPRTAFGETEDKSDVNFFTGKPDVADLGYNFMFRNYRADLGKWQTQDPLGYPDGWNNFAYCTDKPINKVDRNGGISFEPGIYQSRFTPIPLYVASEIPLLESYTILAAAQANIGAIGIGCPLAAAMANYYLSCNGSTYTVTPGDVYDIFSSQLSSFKSDMTEYLSDSFDMGNSVTFISTGSVDNIWNGYRANQTNDLSFSLNWIYYCISGSARKNIDGSIDVSFEIHINDFYDFKPDLFSVAGLGLTDYDWYFLAKTGLACPYNVEGTYSSRFTIPE